MLEKFTSRPVEEILLDLYALKNRERDGEKIEQPLISILLGTSRSAVTGFLIDMKNDVKEKGIVLKLSDPDSVLFVGLYSIAGIVIHEAKRAIPLLVNLSSVDLKELPTVTKLEVKKQLEDQAALLRKSFGNITLQFGEELTTDPAELYFSKLFLSDIAMALVTISKTDMGKEAIQKEANTITIKRGTDLQVKRDTNGLTIHYSFDRSYTTNKERQILIETILDVF